MYSYIFPISGGLLKTWLDNGSTNTGAEVIAFHGKNDELVSISEARQAVNILQDYGIEVNLTEFDGGHLGIFTNMKSAITQAVEERIVNLY